MAWAAVAVGMPTLMGSVADFRLSEFPDVDIGAPRNAGEPYSDKGWNYHHEVLKPQTLHGICTIQDLYETILSVVQSFYTDIV
jgi:hypothetical protein